MLPIKKIQFTHLQQYDKNQCIYLARIGRQREKSCGENGTTHVQHKIIYFCVIYASGEIRSQSQLALSEGQQLVLHSADKPGELSHWFCHDNSITFVITIITNITVII